MLPIIRFTVDEVIERANNNPKRNRGSIWSKDLNKAKQLALQLQCGTAWINKHSPVVQPNAPLGGVKSSGFGVEFGEAAALREHRHPGDLVLSGRAAL